MWDIVEHGYVEPADQGALEALTLVQKDNLRESRKKDKKELFFLYQAVDEAVFERLIDNKRSKVRIASMYLTDIVALWWCRKHVDMERGTCVVNTWEVFKSEIKMQFYSKTPTTWQEEIQMVEALGIYSWLCEGVHIPLSLDISDMPEKELLFNFMDGLQPWAKQELWRRGVQTLSGTIATTKQLTEFKNESSKPKPTAKGDHSSDEERQTSNPRGKSQLRGGYCQDIHAEEKEWE